MEQNNEIKCNIEKNDLNETIHFSTTNWEIESFESVENDWSDDFRIKYSLCIESTHIRVLYNIYACEDNLSLEPIKKLIHNKSDYGDLLQISDYLIYNLKKNELEIVERNTKIWSGSHFIRNIIKLNEISKKNLVRCFQDIYIKATALGYNSKKVCSMRRKSI